MPPPSSAPERQPSALAMAGQLALGALAALDSPRSFARIVGAPVDGQGALVIGIGLVEPAVAFGTQADVEQHRDILRMARFERGPGVAGGAVVGLDAAYGIAERP